jgi:hypothetical protein
MKSTPYDKPNPFPEKKGLKLGDSQNCLAFWEHPLHMAFTHGNKQNKHNHKFKSTNITRQ